MKEVCFNNIIYEPVCIALGFFDSVHIGHRAIIRDMMQKAEELNCKSAVFTFSNNMYGVFDEREKQVYTYDERKRIFDLLGVDYVIKADFDESFKILSPEAFIETLLKNFNIKHIFCGYDYTFGNKGIGNAELLKSICSDSGVDTTVKKQIDYQGNRVSTTLIKSLLKDGDIVGVNVLLSTEYFIEGVVVHGRSVGHTFGMPTANIIFPQDKLLPSCGVYATVASIADKQFTAVTNIGSKPTFGDNNLSIETMIEGLNHDIYGEKLVLKFVKRIRDIKKFSGPKELAEQVHKDINWR